MIFIHITYHQHINNILITYTSSLHIQHTNLIQIIYRLHTYYKQIICELHSHMFGKTAIFTATFSQVLACGLLQGSSVDVPLSEVV